ncbi:27047_t:CDS:2 [Dentiscutata erythropus]|uniref:27047_t:CDS:1 n=1 Tax=Dentiscutata erythropus TaxID=1348616 RepID=A0A9N9A7B5_9GLOM|nr:27047_t:CDS:2 [Dentiscutata erythropus]
MVESKWTRLFIITSIVQTFITIIIQSLVVGRNQNASSLFQEMWQNKNITDLSNPTALDCKANIVARMYNIVGENVIILLSNVFLLFFCYDAIFNQNTIQIITVVVVNYAIGIVAAIQIVEVLRWRNQAVECVPGFLSYNFRVEFYEVPSIVILLLCATMMGFFTWKLYQQFGWNIYKRIGADRNMQKIFRSMLIFVMHLKLDLFFMVVLSIVACVVLTQNETLKHTFLYWFHVIVTVLIFILQALAYHMLREESHLGMKIFIGLWLIPIADFIALLVKSIGTSAQDSWYFFIIFIVFGIIMALLTLIWSIIVLNNFDKGLKRHLTTGIGNIERPPVTEQTSQSQPSGRWAIDEED